MRLVTVVLVVLLALIQYPLWWGHGGWLRVHELREALSLQQQKNAGEKLRNERIEGEVQDLQSGTAAVEERARYEMGMLKDGEVFVQYVSPNAIPSVAAVPPANNTSTRGEVSAAPVSVVPNPVSRVKSDKGGKKQLVEKSKQAADKSKPVKRAGAPKSKTAG
ncbi:MAG TPA: cell division protein FtsB [Trinickia sp.]|jgi:cell division protein FtsB|nr:cell division protein FtsB [Trinickia sp.]